MASRLMNSGFAAFLLFAAFLAVFSGGCRQLPDQNSATQDDVAVYCVQIAKDDVRAAISRMDDRSALVHHGGRYFYCLQFFGEMRWERQRS